MSEFFIRRPIVAIVISIIIVIMGAFTLKGLSFEMYPVPCSAHDSSNRNLRGSFCRGRGTIRCHSDRTGSQRR